MSIYSIPPAIGAFLALALASFVLSKKPRLEANLAFFGTCMSLFFWLASYAIAYSTKEIQLARIATRVACTSVVLFAPFLYHFVIAYLKLLDERVFLKVVYLITGFLILGFVFSNLFLNGVWKYSWGFYSKAGPLHPIQILFTATIWLRCIHLLRRAVKLEREQLHRRSEISFMLFAVTVVLPANIDYLQKYGVDFYPFGFVFALAYVFLAAYAVVKYRLLELEFVVQKGLVYSILATIITASYFVAVLVMEKWFQGFFGYRSVVATAIVGFAIAMGFVPLRNYIQRFVDHYFFHRSHEELVEENEQLRKQVERTERLKAVATLAAGMAHEIKNPLTSIKTFAEYLPEKYDDPAFREKFAKIMGQEVDKMNELIQRLLEFAKPSPPQLGLVEVSNTIKETLDFIQGTLVKKQVQVETSFGAPDQVAADKAQLKQVFLNLLLNSVEAMDGPGRIHISTARKNGHVQVSVSDTGPGIAPKDLQHVFDPFYTTKPTGTGLGLSVVHSIIRQHGGRVNIQSKVGQGTTVRIDLPVNGGSHG